MDEVGTEREGCGVTAMAKVQARGQFTIPEAVRKATGVSPGASLLVRAPARTASRSRSCPPSPLTTS